MIRQADKGGAFAVWRTDLYIAEVQRQLADQRFYKKIQPASCMNYESHCRTPAHIQILLVAQDPQACHP